MEWKISEENIEYVGNDYDVEFFNVACTFNVNPPIDRKHICVPLNSDDDNIQKYVFELKNAINKLNPKKDILDRVKSLPRNTIGMHKVFLNQYNIQNQPDLQLQMKHMI